MRTTSFSAERREATKYWNELLAGCADPHGLAESLIEAQREEGLWLDDRPFCSVARPRLVAAAEMVVEEHAATCLTSALRKVHDAVLAGDVLRRAGLGRFEEWAQAIIGLEPRAHEAWSILRLDSFLTDEGLHFVEVNGDIPMGSVGNDGAIRLFRDLEIFPAFAARYEVRPNLVNFGMVHTFMHAWQSWGGTGTPRICIVSFEGGMQDTFARLNERALREQGFEATAAYPQDLEWDGRRLRARGEPVDLVYRLQHYFDVLDRPAEMEPLLQAVRAEAVCMVNPFRSALMSNKSLFALLTDAACDFGFSATEAAAIRAHVPWGRTLHDGASTDPEGRPIDLVAWVLAHKDELVLKPTHDAGGAGVELGWTCDPGAWEAAVGRALQEDSVVQRRVGETLDEYPRLEPGFPLETFYEDTDPFVFPGGYVAVFDRVSSAQITNVARGGSMVPTFVIDPK